MFYNKTRNEVVEDLESNEQYGLHANEIETIRGKCGYNELQEQKKQSLFIKFLLQFTDPLIIVLIVAAIVSIAVDPHEWIDSLIIVIVVIFNAVLGVVQENNAEKSLEALKKMSAPNSKVVRDGERLTIPSRELVVGDVVILEAGDFIPSDGRILESFNLKVDESALTGESLPVNKISDVIEQENVPLGDQKNMVFASTVVTYGRGKMIVTTVGMNNEVGKIATMLMSSEKETTPLQNKLAQISKVIGVMCLGICAVVFGLEWMSGLSILESFKTSVALAVAAIPEGLATVVTIVLAIGVTKMVKNNAIVRKLPAVETLGSASVVCSDKTGTLTQNKMTVVKTYTIDEGVQAFDGKGNEAVREMMKCFTLCSDAEIKFEGSEMKLLGDPTETALVEASFKMGDKKEDMHLRAKRSDEIAFDSTRKMMTVFFETEKGVVSLTKGAPDVIMSRCTNTPKDAVDSNETMANQALRVLAVAYRIWNEVPVLLDPNEVENNMTFIGLVGMIDPPRPEVKVAIEEAKQGGIRTIMITGDHVTTAKAIATDLGILLDGQKAITGTELGAMSEEELAKELENISVYARVAPEHKVRIVSAWQAKGHVVAMTGDGVNDSPALKKADIGCAMGITGTDVSKGAADMILTDDNFATIIHAVREGRGIYNNIKKDVQFLLSSNIGEVLTIFTASILSVLGYNLGVPLLPVHLLWVNLITDTLPAFALGLEPVDKDIMKEKPRPKNESFFAHGLGWTIAWQGVMVGSLTLIAYIIGNNITHEIGMTMAFMTLSLSQLFHAFNIKSSHSIFHKTIFNNKYLWGALAVGMILQIAVMYVPGLNTIFSLEPLSLELSMTALGLALCPIVIVEIVKLFKNHILKK
ncbi:MAG: calcium-translocating P-type ATPase, PMCA-type [Anaerorhabdus sp.]|uniref:calcium-translocating P-type ATPase, PMCA-type n=1 Tax=Anaerorhabdus sp. TaxID=1872524 RepID=UPI002B20DA5A|nr:calcium-translocating P-type ATPase, PMCA-type [Anaerorhabdus sp.]MEA4876108.1 calcium-translocating P-type ATPase, PMCA-type [Anaerorhabdus sp.]